MSIFDRSWPENRHSFLPTNLNMAKTKHKRYFGHLFCCFFYSYRTCPIVILPWKDIPKRSEFRCFIFKKKITAISQWWCYDEFDFQLQEKMKIQNAIQIFFEKIKEHTPYENCVMDVRLSFFSFCVYTVIWPPPSPKDCEHKFVSSGPKNAKIFWFCRYKSKNDFLCGMTSGWTDAYLFDRVPFLIKKSRKVSTPPFLIISNTKCLPSKSRIQYGTLFSFFLNSILFTIFFVNMYEDNSPRMLALPMRRNLTWYHNKPT